MNMSAPAAALSTASAGARLSPAKQTIAGNGGRQNSKDDAQPGFLGNKAEALICVVDTDASLHKEVRRLLQSEKIPIESFATSEAFLNRKVHDGACCIVLDGDEAGSHGTNFQNILSNTGRSEQVILVSGRGDAFTCAQAFKAGAIDFLAKPLKNQELLRAVRTGLIRSERLFGLRKLKEAAHALLRRLTPREREVFGFVIAGRLNKVIAAELGITEKMVKKHRGHLMKKLEVSSAVELVWFSLQCGVSRLPAMGD